MSCQLCDGTLRSVIHLGNLPPVNALTKELKGEMYYPLHLGRCNSCGHVQLMPESILPTEILFPKDYPYRSGTTKELLQNFDDLAVKLAKLQPTTVVDIGGNDGSLLDAVKKQLPSATTINIEPTDSGKESLAKGHAWSVNDAMTLVYPQAIYDVILCTNAFAHIPDPRALTEKLSGALKVGGHLVVEVQYVGKLVYDTIYHEHMRYYSAADLLKLFAKYNLKVIKIEEIPTHGGSLRVWARKEDGPVNINVPAKHDEFNETQFLEQTKHSFAQLWPRLLSIKAMGHKIVGVGAPSRAATFLCYTGAWRMLDYIVENSTSPKVGMYMPGTSVKVEDEAKMLTDKPGYAMILAWHLAPQIMKRLREKSFRGKFIVPLPEVKVYD